MKSNFITLFLTLYLVGFSQNKSVEVNYSKENDGFVFIATNNENVQQEITLTLKTTNLRGYKKPITKLIPANSSIEMIKLYFIRGKKGKFSSQYTYKISMTEEEQLAKQTKLQKKRFNENNNLNEGIVVFSKDGCPRCHFTTSYLLDNDIDFRFINTSEGEEQNKMMWSILKKENPHLRSVKLPVIIVNGEMSYNIKDLKKMVENLNKNIR